MGLDQKLLVKPGKTTRKLKLKDWDPDYDADKRKVDVDWVDNVA